MTCPNCGAMLVEGSAAGVQAAYCAACYGHWLEDGQVQRYLEHLQSSGQSWKSGEAGAASGEIQTCPACRSAVEPFHFAYDSGVMLDRCTHCGGLWIREESLPKLSEYFCRGDEVTAMGSALARETQDRQRADHFLETMAQSDAVTIAAFTGIGTMPLPLAVDDDIRLKPFVTWFICFVCFVVYALEVATDDHLLVIAHMFGTTPYDLLHGRNLYTLATFPFFHVGLWHVALNVFFLWVFGRGVESQLGHLRFLIMYMVCAVCGALMQAALFPDLRVPSMGASGAVFGVMAAHLVLIPRARMHLLVLFSPLCVSRPGGMWRAPCSCRYSLAP